MDISGRLVAPHHYNHGKQQVPSWRLGGPAGQSAPVDLNESVCRTQGGVNNCLGDNAEVVSLRGAAQEMESLVCEQIRTTLHNTLAPDVRLRQVDRRVRYYPRCDVVEEF